MFLCTVLWTWSSRATLLRLINDFSTTSHDLLLKQQLLPFSFSAWYIQRLRKHALLYTHTVPTPPAFRKCLCKNYIILLYLYCNQYRCWFHLFQCNRLDYHANYRHVSMNGLVVVRLICSLQFTFVQHICTHTTSQSNAMTVFVLSIAIKVVEQCRILFKYFFRMPHSNHYRLWARTSYRAPSPPPEMLRVGSYFFV